MMEFECPHCGSKEGTWFDRSTSGDEYPYEDFPDRCITCGKNVAAPKEYYE